MMRSLKFTPLAAIAIFLIGMAFGPVRTLAQNVAGGTVSGTTLAATNTTNQVTLGAAAHTTVLSFTAPAAASQTLTFPDPTGADSVAYLALAQTFTNKTLTSPTISGTPVISGAALSSGNFIGYPAVQSSAGLGGTPVTLTAAQCGQAFAFDAATGIIYILPSTLPTPGCTYDFYASTSVTSNNHEIESGNAAHFMEGTVVQLSATATARADQCNGSSHIAYKMAGTTLGGLIGTHIRATVVSATLIWLDGLNFGSGTLATACSTTN